MEVVYSSGPRYLDGINIDADVDAAHTKEQELKVSDSVTGLTGLGYEPGQKNKDGNEL